MKSATQEHLVVAIDNMGLSDARELEEKIGDRVRGFKLGISMIYRYGLEELLAQIHKVEFGDAKLHDIPVQVAGAAYALAEDGGIPMFNVHGTGGRAMMAAAKAEVDRAVDEGVLGGERPKLIAVTLLTSVDYDTLADLNFVRELNYSDPDELAHAKRVYVQGIVRRIAVVASEEGLDGVVASPEDVDDLRFALPKGFLIVTPGIRLPGANVADQKRIGTPDQAIADGSDILIAGRDFTEADDPNAILDKYDQLIGEGLARRVA